MSLSNNINHLKKQIIYTENNTKIIDSYKLKTNQKIEAIAYEIELTRLQKKIPQTRTIKSYVREIKAHNRLYKLGLFRSRTKDTDLEENIKKWKEILYRIIGW